MALQQPATTRQIQVEPQVPFCCCTMTTGARTVAIIEIVISTVNIVCSIVFLALGGLTYVLQLVYAIVNIIFASSVLKGAELKSAPKLIPYLIWKPITLTFMAIGLIGIGIVYGNLRKECLDMYDDSCQDQGVETLLEDIFIPALAIGSIMFLLGVLCMYVIVQSYHYYSANRGQANMLPTSVSVSTHPNPPIMLFNQGATGPYDQYQPSGYGYPAQGSAPVGYPAQGLARPSYPGFGYPQPAPGFHSNQMGMDPK